MAALSTPASVKTSRRTPIGMPATPPSRNGHSLANSMWCRCGQIVVECSSTPQPVTISAQCTGSMRCSQIADAATPKAKPLPPAATPPNSAPIQRTARVS